MTTNFTHILNENLDQLPGYDYPANLFDVCGELVTFEELYRGYEEEWDD